MSERGAMVSGEIPERSSEAPETAPPRCGTCGGTKDEPWCANGIKEQHPRHTQDCWPCTDDSHSTDRGEG